MYLWFTPTEPTLRDFYNATQKKSEEYHACLTTTIYGETYLDPEKVKARGFDINEAIEVGNEMIRLSGEWFDKTTKEKGFHTMFKEFIDQAPPQFVNKRSNFSSFDDLYDFTKKEKKGNKNNKKLSKKKIRSLMNKASYLVGRKIKLEDKLYVKVIAVKTNDDGVFLEVEEKVGDKLEYYEIMYQQDMVGL
ncbi:8030_t:CDS:2 [Funneliformis caledonium]|uniref:8030_t:CDS:1 n=1 Tax=Funneliformis caledonium TaxID=1117310 RepID=A0A9N8V052_9GLOM|nr:8030_t:CDS:2 [Funneliformis caledonium]